jgi:hypothetical protein
MSEWKPEGIKRIEGLREALRGGLTLRRNMEYTEDVLAGLVQGIEEAEQMVLDGDTPLDIWQHLEQLLVVEHPDGRVARLTVREGKLGVVEPTEVE